ncbi:YgfZ/GcvT domain-containing protein [Noviherbaspirillum denitrificans]|uniref:Folate-binding protein n=1 Tax=Noviherbaspirillum denitrificans TaxID=1968433 RepID=A0A254TBK3_9BURK|nr:folate-binding protein YgfZ [Noviherbaspirillum denitrificans]OWW20021.1 folate-binding protein [Noviherbaspirillum denitrificans]
MTETTNTWLQFLERHGARFDDAGRVEAFGETLPQGGLQRGFVAPLTDTGLIAATGDDAPVFLHNQLTNDVEHLGAQEARLAGYCSPKGRLLATFLMWQRDGAIMLQLPKQIQPAVQKRLQMFILRSKAKLNDVSGDWALLGLGGEGATAALAKWFPQPPASPYAKADSDAGSLIRLPDAFGHPRFQWSAPPAVAESAWPELIKTLSPAATSLWRLTDIHAGVPQVTLPTQEQFVPQMVNFELIGGVNFKKGCYPGQEIVARSQYLGKLKRRMLLASIDVDGVAPGTEVYWSGDPDQPCGMVVNAEHNPEGGTDCLVETKMTAIEEGTIRLGSATGSILRFAQLPYPLPA